MKDTIDALKKARNKCVNTVDKSTVQEIDNVIRTLELKQNDDNKLNKLKWLSIVVKALALLRWLTDNNDIDL